MKNSKEKILDRIVDPCKRLSINWMDVGSRLPRSSRDSTIYELLHLVCRGIRNQLSVHSSLSPSMCWEHSNPSCIPPRNHSRPMFAVGSIYVPYHFMGFSEPVNRLGEVFLFIMIMEPLKTTSRWIINPSLLLLNKYLSSTSSKKLCNLLITA